MEIVYLETYVNKFNNPRSRSSQAVTQHSLGSKNYNGTYKMTAGDVEDCWAFVTHDLASTNEQRDFRWVTAGVQCVTGPVNSSRLHAIRRSGTVLWLTHSLIKPTQLAFFRPHVISDNAYYL
ncbi:hypothetical protein J6590_071861 [Homalodisca vitripennis]|nr:hypothetical protein J6590_071861 [Homalodisca vitripennis]